MEYQLVFPAFIATMAACHLIARIARAMGGDRPSPRPTAGQRGDWYVFFHCRDLTGMTEGLQGGEQRQQLGPRRQDRSPRPVLRAS